MIPNPDLIELAQVVLNYPENVLWFERYTMRDAYTPVQFSGVNLGWIDDRPSMEIDVQTQRHNDRTDGISIPLKFLWQANSTLLADPLAYTPKFSHSTLIRSADV